MRHVRTVHLNFSNPLPGSEQGDVEYEISRRDRQKLLKAGLENL